MVPKFEVIKNIAVRVIIVVAFVGALFMLIAYARGYRFSFENNNLSPNGITSTGIISVSAFPKGSKVYVNGKLKGVTDLNVSLPPGDYKVEVKKDGYTEWVKDIKLKGEIVITLDALLFPKNPSLLSLTNLGVVKAIPYHEGNKIILMSQSDDIEKDGIYLFDADTRPLSFFAPLKLIVLKKYLPADIDLSKTQIYFSPDLQQAIFEFTAESGVDYSYLFTLNEEVTQPFDISSSKNSILASWNLKKNTETAKILETFPKKFRPIATNNFSIISFSPDQTKILYRAKASLDIPLIITPPLIGTNQSTEERSIRENELYVYDKKEDKNYHLDFNDKLAQEPTTIISPSLTDKITAYPRTSLSPVPTLPPDILSQRIYPIIWHSDSKHISIQQEKEIVMIDFDGSNKRTIYSGPFEQGFFYITNTGKLYILTNLNPQNNLFSDLYEIGIQ